MLVDCVDNFRYVGGGFGGLGGGLGGGLVGRLVERSKEVRNLETKLRYLDQLCRNRGNSRQ